MSFLLPNWLLNEHSQSPQPNSKYSLADSLLFYNTPGVAPPSARVDPKLKLAPRRPLRLWDYWKFAALIATKATHITFELVSHKVWGPRRRSWGIEMTLVTSIIRGAERHSALVDIGTIRMVMSLGGLVPLPSDALVTPVTFQVKKRKLRGLLAEYDASETGKRELQGEWVVGKKTWMRLQSEWKAGNRAEGDSPKNPPKRKERVILYVHGGAYYLSSAAAQRMISIPLSKYADARVFALDYRLAPETCFPGPLHDVVSGYLRLVEDLLIPPENIIIAGDSAGGGLALALLLYLRDNNYSLPSSAILMSPWVDLTMSCESWDSNAAYDVVPFPTADNHMNPIALYLGEHTERYLTHPYASPLFGDLKGLPPLLIQAGDAEVLCDEITLLAHKASLAGVEVRHELYEDAIHVFQAYPFLDAARQSFESVRNFVRNELPQLQSRSPLFLASVAERGLEKEIENVDALIVGGDGAETGYGRNQAKDFEHHDHASHPHITGNPSDSDEEKDVAPSWIRSPAWPRTSGSHLFSVGANKDTNAKGGAEIEMIEDITTIDEIPELQLSPPSPEVGLHMRKDCSPRRTRSHTCLGTLQGSPEVDNHNFIRPKARRQRSHHTLWSSELSMSTVQSPPPSPSLRRRSATSSSHPDISLLVENWSRTGPANQTVLYTTQLRPAHSS